MLSDTEKVIFLSRLPAQQLAQIAQRNPNDSVIDSILTHRVKNLSLCLKDWFYPIPLQDRQNIIRCIQNGIDHPSNNFYTQLKQATLPAYQDQTQGLQNMFLGVLEKFAILAPINVNDEKRHFFSFYFKQLEHNALTDRLDEERRVMEIINPKPVSPTTKGAPHQL